VSTVVFVNKDGQIVLNGFGSRPEEIMSVMAAVAA